ncbi:MAG: hypothetical protein KGQ41_00235 [Alphaproteobacteria bacterium]|nr:hypothetical protein [Alphaproteobacteria bacterium]
MNMHSTARGSALIYILIAIALIAALTASFMQPATQQTRTQNSFKLAAELNGQVQMVRAAIQDCILQYPQGDGSINVAGYHPNYPLEPDSTYFPTSPAIRAADKNVANLRCPGNNPGSPNQAQHSQIFGGSTGRFMPAMPALFNPWTYRNGTNMTIDGVTFTGVFFQTTTTNTDAYLSEAMQKVDAQFTQCEADYVDGTGSNGCPASTKCLRIWVKRVAPACP